MPLTLKSEPEESVTVVDEESILRKEAFKAISVWSYFTPAGLYHDLVPAALLEGREASLPQCQQQEHDL